MVLAPAGQEVRSKSGRYERSTNTQQRKLVRSYDEWSVSTRRKLLGSPESSLTSILDSSMASLQRSMLAITLLGITTAFALVARGRKAPPAVVAQVGALQVANNQLVRTSMIPNIRGTLSSKLAAWGSADAVSFRGTRISLKRIFDSARNQPAQAAGGSWFAIFQIQLAWGTSTEQDQRSAGEPIPPVKWLLDANADHCVDSAGFHGCASLAGVYDDGWGSLPTVPAGQVTCRGNCRCVILVKVGKQWKRGI